MAANTAPNWDTIKKIFRFSKDLGKNSLWPMMLLWALDFRAVRQGTRIGYSVVRGSISWFKGVTREVIARSFLLLVITLIFGILTMRLGNTTIFGSFFIVMFGGSLLVLQTYLLTVAMVAAIAIDYLRSRNKTAPVTSTSGTQAASEDSTFLGNTWKIFGQVLYWDFLFLMTLLLTEPWMPGRLKLFFIMLFAEAALFVLSRFTRQSLRYATLTFATAVGAVEFICLIGLHLAGPDMAVTTRAMIDKVNDKLVFSSSNGYRKAVNEYSYAIDNWRSLPAELQVVDMNEDDELDSLDLVEVETTVHDSNRVVHRTIDGVDVVLGDFNGDGEVTPTDRNLFASYLKKHTPLLPSMAYRRRMAAIDMDEAAAQTPSYPVQTPPPHSIQQQTAQVPATVVTSPTTNVPAANQLAQTQSPSTTIVQTLPPAPPQTASLAVPSSAPPTPSVGQDTSRHVSYYKLPTSGSASLSVREVAAMSGQSGR